MQVKKFKDLINSVIDDHAQYQSTYKSFTPSKFLITNSHSERALKLLTKRLKDTYPFFHPHYAGQMLKPPAQIASLAYFSVMLMNPNNHALDGGPSTSELEKEAVDEIAKMIGYKNYLGHLTSSGTLANLEGLWISRMVSPKSNFAICENAHYTHTRLSQVLGFKYEIVQMNDRGQMDIDHLSKLVKAKKVGNVVVTLGTTGFGSLDPLHMIIELKKKYKLRVHVDAAYGGFFKILQNEKSKLIDHRPFELLHLADSVAIDPHKHGLQPYGCGCILFNDTSVGKFYKHDSPYTYFTSKDLHLGEVSLECSRAGASAAALWATLKVFPLNSKKGLYKILSSTRKAALRFQQLAEKNEKIKLVLSPELDIVNYFPNETSTAKISTESERIFNTLMNRKSKPIYLSKYRVNSDYLLKLHPNIRKNSEETIILRSTLMKPEHEQYVDEIFEEIVELVR
ncbi:MAG: aminotransferase class V-fold PLP-dependent enzyme [Bacteroidetes bacterium]|nr:aminotransferase class V-fold PLP-dependent enzyme [Bacteroidota bacterium]